MYVGFHVKYPLFLSDFNDAFSRQIFEKYSNTTLQDNALRGSQVVPCGRTDGQTDMTKLTVALRNLRTCLQNQSVYVV
jgi:hypothetical protein